MRDTIDMAREAGELKCDCCLPYYGETDIEGFEGFLKRFAELVRADERSVEREACAKVCEDAFSSSHAGRVVCDNLAYAIRARGNT
jgi:hypothetical protein